MYLEDFPVKKIYILNELKSFCKIIIHTTENDSRKKKRFFFHFRIHINILKCRYISFFYWFNVKLLFNFFTCVNNLSAKLVQNGKGSIFN